MIRPLIIISLLSLAAIQIAAEDPNMMRFAVNEAFGLGERLEYDVGYRFIKAGTAVFSVGKEPVNVNGRPCYDIRFDVMSLSSLDFL